jgi:hypothetical protein
LLPGAIAVVLAQPSRVHGSTSMTRPAPRPATVLAW